MTRNSLAIVLILTVLVTPTSKEEQRVRTSAARTRQIEDALLLTVRTRKAP